MSSLFDKKLIASFTVPGDPATQGSMTPMMVGGRMRARHGRKLLVWRSLALPIAKVQAPREPFAGPVYVEVDVMVRRGKTVTRERPTSQRDGDLDKYVRAACDVLSMAGIIKDDSQVIGMSAHKRYSPTPRMFVSVFEMVPRC